MLQVHVGHNIYIYIKKKTLNWFYRKKKEDILKNFKEFIYIKGWILFYYLEGEEEKGKYRNWVSIMSNRRSKGIIERTKHVPQISLSRGPKVNRPPNGIRPPTTDRPSPFFPFLFFLLFFFKYRFCYFFRFFFF